MTALPKTSLTGCDRTRWTPEPGDSDRARPRPARDTATQVIPSWRGCIRVPPHQRRKTERNRAIAESAGIR